MYQGLPLAQVTLRTLKLNRTHSMSLRKGNKKVNILKQHPTTQQLPSYLSPHLHPTTNSKASFLVYNPTPVQPKQSHHTPLPTDRHLKYHHITLFISTSHLIDKIDNSGSNLNLTFPPKSCKYENEAKICGADL
jgi:hypothetical protein